MGEAEGVGVTLGVTDGVTEGLGVVLGVAEGVILAVALGVAVAEGVAVADGVGVGVGEPDGQLPLTFITICMSGKPRSAVGVGSTIPQSAALR